METQTPERIRWIVKQALLPLELDPPISDYLSWIAAECQSQGAEQLVDALADVLPPGQDASVVAAAIISQIASQNPDTGVQAAVQQALQHDSFSETTVQSAATPKSGLTLRAGAAEFVPRASPAVPTPASIQNSLAKHAGHTELPSAASHTPAPWQEEHAEAYPSWSSGSNAALSEAEAAELLAMWFPSYGILALKQLFKATQDLFVCVEELFLMEGEEPFANRLDAATPANQRTDSQQAARPSMTEVDFPSLATAASTAAHKPGSQPSTKWSAKDALLSRGMASSARPAAAGWGQRTGAGVAWQASPAAAANRPVQTGGWGGAPIVETGTKLTQLYEESRAEAKEHAYQRIDLYRKAAAAFVNGNRDLARRLSARAQQHKEAMAQADAQAAAHIFWARNAAAALNGTSPFLDLHGLHVKEACSVLTTILEQRQQQPRSRGRGLMVCTGVGKHSERILKTAATSGVSGRLEAAVERLLKAQGVPYQRVQPGLFKVT